jgi:hypothetical protein
VRAPQNPYNGERRIERPGEGQRLPAAFSEKGSMPRKKFIPVSTAAAAEPRPVVVDAGAVVAADAIAGVHFAPLPRAGRSSVYLTNLLEAVNKGGAVAVPASRANYLVGQYRSFAVKAGIRLLFAHQGDQLLIKPMPATEDEKRLMLMLRSPRTYNEIESWKVRERVEISLKPTLERLREAGLVSMTNDGKWGCTALGQDEVKATKRKEAA